MEVCRIELKPVRRSSVSAVYDKLLLPSEVAAILRVTKRTLWNWERRGILVPIRLPTGQKRYRREDVEGLFEKSKLRSYDRNGLGN